MTPEPYGFCWACDDVEYRYPTDCCDVWRFACQTTVHRDHHSVTSRECRAGFGCAAVKR
jgi:hypothetical protein